MALYLVQHGKSLPKETDPDPGLSDAGIAETRRIAETAVRYGLPVKEIRHSGKTRARQTAEIFSEALSPEKGLQEREGLKPMDDVTVLSPELSPGQDLMLVGHLPFLSRLAAYLVAGRTEPPVLRFQNSGIVCLDKAPEDPWWVMVWTLMPRIS
ncbi:MAG: phosphohistidine phosphatase SixA [Deltaproteobacteria bacterium]|nr:phosphohistidine phosphatase SixA [Deltaproteobacteria bacterium]MBW2042416.1 phosphohistidine phosphatase SixA [Deltaproteobacteria bacterium]MBW2131059.1 phosphohistidine phosphatase SixA [Deltaproteobacteria bacterium]